VALTTPPSDVIPPLAQVHLLGRVLGVLTFGAAVGGLSGMLGRLLSKGSPRLFPLNTVPVVHRMVGVGWEVSFYTVLQLAYLWLAGRIVSVVR
jgi:hypothetical protein